MGVPMALATPKPGYVPYCGNTSTWDVTPASYFVGGCRVPEPRSYVMGAAKVHNPERCKLYLFPCAGTGPGDCKPACRVGLGTSYNPGPPAPEPAGYCAPPFVSDFVNPCAATGTCEWDEAEAAELEVENTLCDAPAPAGDYAVTYCGFIVMTLDKGADCPVTISYAWSKTLPAMDIFWLLTFGGLVAGWAALSLGHLVGCIDLPTVEKWWCPPFCCIYPYVCGPVYARRRAAREKARREPELSAPNPLAGTRGTPLSAPWPESESSGGGGSGRRS